MAKKNKTEAIVSVRSAWPRGTATVSISLDGSVTVDAVLRAFGIGLEILEIPHRGRVEFKHVPDEVD